MLRSHSSLRRVAWNSLFSQDDDRKEDMTRTTEEGIAHPVRFSEVFTWEVNDVLNKNLVRMRGDPNNLRIRRRDTISREMLFHPSLKIAKKEN